MLLVVCGVGPLEQVIAARRPSHLITLLDPATLIDTPSGIAPERHLRLGVNDICEPMEGLVLPDEACGAKILEFGRTWDESAPMVVHCWAGISRSTAAAFIAACALRPDRKEDDIARALRQASPIATPNRRLVAVADEILGRHGGMTEAIERIGRGQEASEGEPFRLTLE